MIRPIPFSPPYITDSDIQEVVDTLKSGWITTGPKTKLFEKELSEYCGVEKTVCLNSATAGLELSLRMLDIGPGDEVITTPFTYAATANVILHTGAKPVFADVKPGEFNIDPKGIEQAITKRTKAVIPVDYGGFPCDYDEIKAVLEHQKHRYKPKKKTWQEHFEKPAILSDSAHSLGSVYKGKKAGSIADFSVFSFHAVKNLTTAEGGAVAFHSRPGLPAEEVYKRLQLLSLHGQNKDALEKMKAGGWKYSIDIPGYERNMTDIQAALGLSQLRRYENEILPLRRKVFETYMNTLKEDDRIILPRFLNPDKTTSYHLVPIRLRNRGENERDKIIQKLSESGIAANVHYIPVVVHPAYTSLGYHIENYPNALSMYVNEISLPIYPALKEDEVIYVCNILGKILDEFYEA